MATAVGEVLGRGWAWMTGKGASLVALAGFMTVSVGATAMGFSDLSMANADKTSLRFTEALPIWMLTVFVILAMEAALNAALGVGLPPVKAPLTPEALALQKRKIELRLERKHKSRAGSDARLLDEEVDYRLSRRNARTLPHRLGLRLVAFVFYLFFAFWSVGFGYGFFWKELAGQEYTQNQFRVAIESVSRSTETAASALETVESSVIGAASLARSRADEEAAHGGACANRPGSKPGDGPLTRGRFAFADRAQALRDDVAASWTQKLAYDRAVLERRVATLTQGEVPTNLRNVGQDELNLLNDLAQVNLLSSARRKQVFSVVFDDARAFVAKANTLRNAHVPVFAGRLDDLARQVGPDPDNPGRADPAREDDPTYCWDTVLTEKLTASAAALRALNDMPPPKFEFTEGPKATRAAFFNLARAAIHVMTTPVRLLTGDKAAGDGVAFGEKEWIALFASIAVDAGILFLTMVRAAMEHKGQLREPRTPSPMHLKDLRRAARDADEGNGRAELDIGSS